MYFRWTPEKINLLKQYYPTATWDQLYTILGYSSKAAIKSAAKKYRIFRGNKFGKNIKQFNKDDLINSLIEETNRLGRTPMIKEFGQPPLYPEVTYRRYFGSIENAFKIAGLQRQKYGALITGNNIVFDKLGNPCYSITEQNISNFLIDNNIVFEKEVYYSSVIQSKQCHNKRFDWKIGDRFIEYFGLIGYRDYDTGVIEKIQLCQQHNIKLLALFPQDMNAGWQQSILNFIKN